MIINSLRILEAVIAAKADQKASLDANSANTTSSSETMTQIDYSVFPPQVAARLKSAQIAAQVTMLKSEKIWWVDWLGVSKALLYETRSGLVWDAKPIKKNLGQQKQTHHFERETFESKDVTFCDTRWQLPSAAQLLKFAAINTNPLRSGCNNRILGEYRWLVWDYTAGKIVGTDLDYAAPFQISYLSDNCITCASKTFSPDELAQLVHDNKWRIHSVIHENKYLDEAFCAGELFQPAFKDIDYQICRLPELEAARFTDPNKGMWEFWGLNDEHLGAVRARNPAEDVKDWNIAIDFGTSSTVVAYDDNGQHKLLRVGVKDFYEAPTPDHYENPTVLEFIDFQNLLRAWQAAAYRPELNWDDVRCSHEALHNLRNNAADPLIVGSVLSKIKQWAVRQAADRPVLITDQGKQFEHQLAPLSARNPVRNEALKVGGADPFDPLELYAWFLGMNINWRGRGLFLHYYMTFPVAYSREVKDKVLASFRRGLQRSLPEALIQQPIFSGFSVQELASEPAAYAAAALPLLGVEPTAEGVAYAVFDFGGGTTDFDFGYYRLPNAEEEDGGCEKVFQHCGSEGDPFLGGENLLENLAYRVFQHNLDICRQNKIAFTKPLDANDFPGSELFLEKTQAAATNTQMLMSRLRPLWERGALETTSGIEKINLLDRENKPQSCELAIPLDKLTSYLVERIELGIQNFFAAMKTAFAEQPQPEIHVLLAGNSSRSKLVSAFFNVGDSSEFEPTMYGRTRTHIETVFGTNAPKMIVHAPLPMDELEMYRPTAKTGVALGLLALCPGGVIEVKERASATAGDQAPFAFYVGRIRREVFQPALSRGADYNQWHEVGPPRDRVFNLFYSEMPKANTGTMSTGDQGLFKKRLDLAGDYPGHRVFVRALTPTSIEYCTAASLEDAQQGQLHNLNKILLA